MDGSGRRPRGTTAAGITDDTGTLPDGFWSHAASVAVACSLVAPRVSVRGPEAFSLGLLHDLGAALLQRGLGPIPADAPGEVDDADRIAYERERWVDLAPGDVRVLAAKVREESAGLTSSLASL